MKQFIIIIFSFSLILYSNPKWNIAFEQYYESRANDIIHLNQNSNLVVGTVKEDSNSSTQIFFLNVDNLGNINNFKIFNSLGTESSPLIRKVEGNKFIITVYKSNNEIDNCKLYKIDEQGNIIWEHEYFYGSGSSGIYFAYLITDIKFLNDGNYLMTILNRVHCEYSDQWFVKVDASTGNVIWSKNCHAQKHFIPRPKMFLNPDDSFVVFGSFRTDEQNIATISMRTFDNTANLQEEFFYFDPNNHLELYSAVKISSGGYLLTGRSIDIVNGTYSYWFLLKLDENLEVKWRKNYYGEEAYKQSVAYDIIETFDNNFIAVGRRNYYGSMQTNTFQADYAITKFDTLGNIIWEVLLSEDENFQSASSIVEVNEGNLISVGRTNCTWLTENAYIVAIDKDGNHNVEIANDESSIKYYQLSQCYPNPFNPVTTINYDLKNNFKNAFIVVYNIKGQQIWQSEILKQNSNQCLFNGSKFNSGIYYYSLIVDGKKMDNKSMVLIK